MKRMIAWIAYVVGGVFALKSAALGLTSGGIFDAFGGIAYGIVFWWIAVGIGVRLGVTPDDFLASVVSTLGFRRDVERDVVVTEDAPTAQPPV